MSSPDVHLTKKSPRNRTSKTKSEVKKQTRPSHRLSLNTISRIQTLAKKIYNCYHKGFAPPKWALHEHTQWILTHPVICYYPSTHSRVQCKNLLSQREPVNIATKGADVYFNKKRLNDALGYTKGLYNDYRVPYEHLPNISVYHTSPVKHTSGKEPWKEVDKMHFLHCVGYAFDSKHQRDYREIVHNKPSSHYIPRLLQLYTHIFHTVFQCAKTHGLTHIALGLVGAGVFATLYPSDFKSDIFQPALESALHTHQWNLSHIATLGQDKVMVHTNTGTTRTLKRLGYFPSECISKIDPRRTLVVNAWDPLSMVGNGNAGDNSLDGWIGRHTACALQCFPPTNPYIEYKSVASY